MTPEPEKRVAALAVSRFGADRARVEAAIAAATRARAEGKQVDVLDVLVRERLLSRVQATELRRTLQAESRVEHPRRSASVNSKPASVRLPSKESEDQPLDDTAETPAPELGGLGVFRLLRRIGEGGMGSVYLGYDQATGRQVAIKILPDALAKSGAYIERFYREARSMALLDHPNIVRGVAVGKDPPSGKHYLVLEYVDGPSAHALLDRFGRLSVGDAVHIALDIARALEHAHSRNVIHRDIKPDNILLTKTGVAKLSDLGLARRTDETSHLTGVQQGFGTPFYMPYEQALNAKQADGRSDIYALGATLYHLLTGEVPFSGSSHLEVAEKKEIGVFASASTRNAAVPPTLDKILDKMMARFPEDRYQTASELIVDLERSHLGAPVPSFVDPDLALQDPLVRARLVAPAEPTQPDLASLHRRKQSLNRETKIWYVRYRSREGKWRKARATTGQIAQHLQAGKLRATAEVSREPNGTFRPLMAYPELRKLARTETREEEPSPNGQKAARKESTGGQAKPVAKGIGKWIFLAGMAGLVILAVLVALVLLG